MHTRFPPLRCAFPVNARRGGAHHVWEQRVPQAAALHKRVAGDPGHAHLELREVRVVPSLACNRGLARVAPRVSYSHRHACQCQCDARRQASTGIAKALQHHYRAVAKQTCRSCTADKTGDLEDVCDLFHSGRRAETGSLTRARESTNGRQRVYSRRVRVKRRRLLPSLHPPLPCTAAPFAFFLTVRT